MVQAATVQDTRRRRALVTGASTGLGAVFATALARQQYDLTIVARSRERLEALAGRLRQSYGIAVEVVVADLTHSTALRTVEERVAGDNALELLVNNAGFGTTGPFARLDPDQEEAEIRLNVLALVRLTRAVLPGMITRGRGAIINVSSLAAFAPGPYDATYSATKAFVNSFSEALYEELYGTGVHVQTLCPGFTHTEFQQRAGVDISKIPTFAWMTPEAVVDASLSALQRHQVVCVPGLVNRLLALLMGAAPRRLVRRVSGLLAHRVLGGADGHSGSG
jgi:short-subunit dehydrogenase